jgi:hypothetical protein
MVEHAIEIVELVELPSGTASRAGKTDLLILYKFDTAGPFQLVVPKETFSEVELRKQVLEQQKLRLDWKGKTIKG